MKRLLVLGGAAAAVLLALHRPAPPPAIASAPLERGAAAPHSRKAHSAQSAAASVVYVVGAVAHPGLYRLVPGARVNDAVQRAGGMSADADAAAVNLAERVVDGEEIRVLRAGETAPAPVRRAKRRIASRKTFHAQTAAVATVDLNTADEDALTAVPGIGSTLASRIVEYRRLNGPFESLDELADVAGMTQRRIDAMAPYVSLNGSH